MAATALLRWSLTAVLAAAYFSAALFALNLGNAPFLIAALAAHAAAAAGFLLWPRLRPRWPRSTALAVIAAAALSPRLAAVALLPNQQVSDFAVYHELAQALLSGRGYALTGPIGREDLKFVGEDKALPYTTAYRPPGTAVWAAFLYKVFGADPLVVKLFNALLGAGTCLLIFLLLERAGLAALALPAALLWALYPAAVLSTRLVCSEVPSSFLLTLLAYQLTRLDRRKADARASAGAGAVAAACSLFRATWGPLAAAGGLALALGLRRGAAAARLAAFAAAMAAGLLPWSVRNWTALGRLVPICTDEGVFFGRQTSLLIQETLPVGPDWRARWESWKPTANEADFSRSGYRLGFRNLSELAAAGPAAAAKVLARGFGHSFSEDLDVPLFSVMNSFGLAQRAGPPFLVQDPWFTLGLAVNHGFYLALLGLALWGVQGAGFAARGANPGLLFPFLYWLICAALLSLVVGGSRYHYFLMLGAVLMAAGAAPPSAEKRT